MRFPGKVDPDKPRDDRRCAGATSATQNLALAQSNPRQHGRVVHTEESWILESVWWSFWPEFPNNYNLWRFVWFSWFIGLLSFPIDNFCDSILFGLLKVILQQFTPKSSGNHEALRMITYDKVAHWDAGFQLVKTLTGQPTEFHTLAFYGILVSDHGSGSPEIAAGCFSHVSPVFCCKVTWLVCHCDHLFFQASPRWNSEFYFLMSDLPVTGHISKHVIMIYHVILFLRPIS